MELDQGRKKMLEEMFGGWLSDNGYVRRPHDLSIAFQEDSEDLVSMFFTDFQMGEAEDGTFAVDDAIELLSEYILTNEPWFSAHGSVSKR